MRSLGPTNLYTDSTEVPFTLPANCRRVEVLNLSDSPIRMSTTTGKVQVSPLTDPPEYDSILPGVPFSKNMKLSSGTLYFGGNVAGSMFVVTAYVA